MTPTSSGLDILCLSVCQRVLRVVVPPPPQRKSDLHLLLSGRMVDLANVLDETVH